MAVCYSGDLDHVDEALAPIRALGEPVFDLLEEQPYAQLQSYLDDDRAQGQPLLLEDRVRRRAERRPARRPRATCPPSARSRRRSWASSTSAGAQRARRGRRCRREPGRPLRARRERHVGARTSPTRTASGSGSAMRGSGSGPSRPAATTSTSRPPTRATTASARPTAPNFDRLVEIKSKYDPDNLFRANRNIRPGMTAASVDQGRVDPEEWRRFVYQVAKAIAPGWERHRARDRGERDADTRMDDQRACAPAGRHGARAGGRRRRYRLRSRRARRHARPPDLDPLLTGDGGGRPTPRRRGRAPHRGLPGDRRREDRAGVRFGRRCSLPVRLHADGTTRDGPLGDPPCAAPRWAPGAGSLGRAGPEPVAALSSPDLLARARARAGTGSRGSESLQPGRRGGPPEAARGSGLCHCANGRASTCTSAFATSTST